MDRPYFEETQYLRQTRWIWYIIVPASLVSFVPLLFWLNGQSNGNNQDPELLITSVLSILGTGLVMVILLSVKLDTRIDKEGIHYRYFPNKAQWNLIRKADIAEVELRTRKNFFNQGITGYHRNVFQKSRSMSIRGADHLWVRLHNNQKVLLGTQDPNELQRAIKRLFTTEIKY